MSKNRRARRFIVASLAVLAISAFSYAMPWNSFGLFEPSQAAAPEIAAASEPAPMLAGVTTNGGSGLALSYPDLASAITALNAATITSPVVITADGTSETAPAGGYSITAQGTAVNTITITGAGTTITASGALTAGALNDGIFKIIGGDYITIQGFTMLENAANTTTTAASNNMTEWGVALLYASTTNGANNITITGNTIDLNRTYQNTFGIYANATHTATAVTTSATATGTAGGNSGLVVTSNSIMDVNQGIVVVGPTAAADFNNTVTIGGSVPNANTITNYGTTGTFSSYANVSGTVNGILVRNSISATVSFNSITSSVGGVTAGTLNGIQFPAFSVAPTGTFTQNVNNNTVSLQSGLAAGAINGINMPSGSASVTSVLNVNNNNFATWGHTVAASGPITFITNASTHFTQSISSNTFTNMTVNTTGSVTFISNSNTLPASGLKNVNNNSIVTGFSKSGAGGTITGFTDNGSSPTGSTNNSNNNNFSNITITGATAVTGISNTDGLTTVTKSVNGNTVTNITGGTTGTVTGINVTSGGPTTISSNTVSNITNGGTTNGITTGTATTADVAFNTIHTLTATGTGTVTGITNSSGTTKSLFKNTIYNLENNNSGGAASGITVSGGTTVTVFNNLIGDLRTPAANAANPLVGLNITGGTTVNAYFNTVYLNGLSSGALFGSSAVSVSTTPTVTLRNNIFVNNSTTTGAGLAVAHRRSSTTLTSYASASNNNDFFASTIYTDGTNTDVGIAAYKARVASRDSASFAENPPFLSTTGSSAMFLHISTVVATQLESGGTAVAGITDDYDGDTRNATTPDVGADEFTGIGIDLSAPSISYSALAGTASTANRSFTGVTITDASGVNTTAGTKPRVYYKRSSDGNVFNDNTSGTDGWKFVEANGATSPFDFTINYALLNGGTGVVAGQTVQYFVVAQDLAGTPNVGINSGTFAAAPSSVALTSAAFPIGGTINSYGILNYLYDFEPAGDEDFTQTTVSVDSWQHGTPAGGTGAPTACNSGTRCWGTDLTGDYENNGDYRLITPTLKATGTTVTWSFMEFYNTESGFDFLRTEVSINGGAFTLLGTQYSGQITAWQTKSFNVTTAVNDIVQFRFRMTTDSSSVRAGWYVDDMGILGAVLVDATAPAISYTILGNTTSTANRNLTPVTITDSTGVNTTAGTRPRIYFKKSTEANAFVGNTSVDNGWKYVETTDTSSPFSFTLDYSLLTSVAATGDTIQYFVVAQDTATTPNVGINSGTFAVVPASVNLGAAQAPIGGTINSYLIQPSISGTKTVGTSANCPAGAGTCDYATLTAAATAVNGAVITGAVTLELRDTNYDASETFPIAFNNNSGSTMANSVTIKPGTGVSPMISGSSATCLINLNGIDYMTIDGSNVANGTTKDTTFSNTNTSGPTVCFVNGAQNNTVKNSLIKGVSTLTTNGVVFFSTTTGVGNNTNTVQNNDISGGATAAAYAVYNSGTSAAKNTNNLITQNRIFDFSNTGIRDDGNSANTTYSRNEIFEMTIQTTSLTGFRPSSTSIDGFTFTQNNIRDLETTGTGSVYGIHLFDTSTLQVSTVSNNFINLGVTAPLTLRGIWDQTATGEQYNIHHNSVQLYGLVSGVSNSEVYYWNIASTSNVRNNIFKTSRAGGTGKHYAYRTNTTLANLTSDYNDIYNTGGTGNVFGNNGTVDIADLATWQMAPTTGTGKDANSISAEPNFVAFATDLHLAVPSPALSAGTPIGTTTIDYDGDPRPASAPDMGADEIVQSVTGTIPAGTYYNALGTNGDTLGGNVTVTNRIELTGIVNTGASTLTIGCTGIITYVSAINHYVVGNLRKDFCTTGSFTYPVGTTPDNMLLGSPPEPSPVIANVSALGTNPSSLTVNAVDAFLPLLDQTNAISRYWSLTETGDLTADVTFTYLDADINGNEALYKVFRAAPGLIPLEYVNHTVNAGANTGTANAVQNFSHWSLGAFSPTAAGVDVSGRILTPEGAGLRNAIVTLTDSRGVVSSVRSSSFGNYRFEGVRVGETYILGVNSRRYVFTPRVVQVLDEVTGLDVTADGQQ